LFLEPYRLEENPFSGDRLHPVYRSLSYEYASRKIAQLVAGKLDYLFISGPAGVGKTLLIDKELGAVEGIDICRLEPRQDKVEDVLRQMLSDIGPGPVAGSVIELRNILHVFLRHQAARGRRVLVVADDVDRDSLAVVREIEALAQLRLRGIPSVNLLMTTRNEELITQFRSRNDTGLRHSSHHQRYTGFTLDETEAYLRSVLLGAGCEWFDVLIPDELVFEIQAFTQGIVGDIDALMREALEQLASISTDAIRQQSLDVGLLKDVARKLRLRYDAAAWKTPHEEVLLPSAIRQSRRDSLRIEAAKLAVSSGGRMIAEISLNRPRMVLGRDASCDISLDSSYVSRYQNLFMATSEGWMLIDLNSTNGCFVNGRRVAEHKLRDGDLITLGQHHIRFSGQPVDYASHEDAGATLTRPAQALSELERSS
jgi:type II secretory pathway predicted ATPase ExeA